MTPKKGWLVYRCRRCGKEVKVAAVNHLPSALRAVCVKGSLYTANGKEEFASRPHTCADKNVGVMDIIGGEYEVETKE
ncbi:hypothetical protein FWH30_01515 [Microgenomates group bacterium]|nr:hypothetical protein [Microgenomates group bacterium]